MRERTSSQYWQNSVSVFSAPHRKQTVRLLLISVSYLQSCQRDNKMVCMTTPESCLSVDNCEVSPVSRPPGAARRGPRPQLAHVRTDSDRGRSKGPTQISSFIFIIFILTNFIALVQNLSCEVWPLVYHKYQNRFPQTRPLCWESSCLVLCW